MYMNLCKKLRKYHLSVMNIQHVVLFQFFEFHATVLYLCSCRRCNTQYSTILPDGYPGAERRSLV